MMPDQTLTTITLRALEGEPLRKDLICEMVEATARAIAERQGIAILALASDATSITATLAAGRIEAIGFAAELRRLTTSWFTSKYGQATLWGDPPDEVHEASAEWRDPNDDADLYETGEDDDDDQPDDDENDEHWLGDPDGWKNA